MWCDACSPAVACWQTDVAEVNGEEISEIELNQQLYRQRQALIARMGEEGDPSQIDDVMLKGAVLQNMRRRSGG